MSKVFTVVLSACVFALIAVAPVRASDITVINVTIKNHRFIPDRIEVEAGKPFTLIVKNEDPTPEEFESHDFNREKIINGNSSAKIRVGALKAGEHKFFGEFNEDTAQGVIVAK
ncbi:MAG: cupredoxin domain-containing protein [Alphaproteobacteria bacterium]|nr:MAG: cupredoxin domain-containing protein [Alphaproteobacteria bacterium]